MKTELGGKSLSFRFSYFFYSLSSESPLSGNKELLLPGENAINPFIGSKQHKGKRFFVREELFFGGSLPFFFPIQLNV
jgi:hypothetical protein